MVMHYKQIIDTAVAGVAEADGVRTPETRVNIHSPICD